MLLFFKKEVLPALPDFASAPVSLPGFDPEFTNFPHYILGITEQIWEGRNVGAIRRYYAPNCLVHTGMGSSANVQAVITGTLEKQHQFPDRLILGEDIIWSGTPERGLLSSHRSMMTQTHRGAGPLGAPTGRPILMRCIADCAARDNMIYEEWLAVDQSAAVLQAGLDPADLGRAWAAADDAAGLPQPLLAFAESRPGPDTREIQPDPAASLLRDHLTAIWGNQDLSAPRRNQDRAITHHLPGGVTAHGPEAYETFALGYLASFPDATFSILHSIAQRDPGHPIRVATRWTLTGTHSGTGTFGPPTATPVLILGITHTELHGTRIVREWTMIDEMAIWRRLARKHG